MARLFCPPISAFSPASLPGRPCVAALPGGWADPADACTSAIPAAVISMAVLHALGGGHILENNIVQTGASAAASIAAGVIFTIPALVIIGYWPDFEYGWVLTIAGLGGILVARHWARSRRS